MARLLDTPHTTPIRALAAMVCALAAIGVSPTTAGATVGPLPQSNYVVRPACSAPTQGRASCLALGLEPRSVAARARVHPLATKSSPHTGLTQASECAVDYPSTCLTPQNLRNAYLSGEQLRAPESEPQTIALVDAYGDPSAEADLNVYAAEFGLPACTRADGCFKQMSEGGGEATSSLPFPKTKAELEAFAKGTTQQRKAAEEAEGWALETATDIEVAHAICQNCHILLVEASSPEYPELETAENTAAIHANEISDSWGGPEGGVDDQAFDHPGIAIVAAAGDDGYLNWDQYAARGEPGSPYFQGADYPASSPHVISVGGTSLTLNAGGTWQSESAWNSRGAGGSGCSDSLPAPTWQLHVGDWAQVGCGQHRANADIAADADPSSGVDVYDSIPYPYEEEGKRLTTVLHWAPIGGTSVAAPIIASMFALAGGAHGVAYPAQTLYSHLESTLLHDVSTGGSGECNGNYSACSGSLSSPLDCGAGAWICNATNGYDGPTGVGTPNGIGAFEVGGSSTGGGGEGEHKNNPLEESKYSTGGDSPTVNEASGIQSTGGPSSSSAGGGPGSTADGTSGKSGPASVGIVTHVARVSAFELTSNARTALRHHRPTIAQVAFSFVVSRAVSVRATFTVRVGVGAHAHWRALPVSLMFAAVKGLNRRRLHSFGELQGGLYRLTLAPSGGTARSISFRVP